MARGRGKMTPRVSASSVYAQALAREGTEMAGKNRESSNGAPWGE